MPPEPPSSKISTSVSPGRQAGDYVLIRTGLLSIFLISLASSSLRVRSQMSW
jgi:hypothetical protein